MAAAGGLTLLLAFSIAAALTPLVRDLARRHGLLDYARSSRKVHGRPIPRLGGVAIVLAFYAAVAAAMLWPSLDAAAIHAEALRDPAGASALKPIAFLLGGVAIALLGLYDDLKGAGARQKFTVQFAVAILLYAVGFRIEVVSNPFGDAIALGWLSFPVTLLWITGVVNAMNLMDGLDGVAGGLAIAGAVMIFAVGADAGHAASVIVATALAGAVGGFLLYNFNPASIFMGDTGSMFIGYVLATSALQPQRRPGEVALVAFVVALGLPIVDTLAAMVRRAARGVPLFVADREHVHHRLLNLGLTPRQVAVTLWAGAALLAGAGATLAGCSPATMLLAVVAAATLGWSQLGGWNVENAAALRVRRRQNVERRRAIRAAGERLRRARRLADLAEPLEYVGAALGARSIRLRLGPVERIGEHGLRRFDPGDDASPSFRTTHGIFGEHVEAGAIEVVWDPDRTALDRDSEIAVELLCAHVAVALRHMGLAAPSGAPLLRPVRTTRLPSRSAHRAVSEDVDRATPG